LDGGGLGFTFWFTIATGIASLYGAYEARRQRIGAEAQRRAAEKAARDAQSLFEAVATQRLFEEAIGRCRRCDFAIASDMAAADEQLREIASILGRLAGNPASRGLTTPTEWRRMSEEFTQLRQTLTERGKRPLTNQLKGGAAAMLMRNVTELARLSAVAESKIGAEHGSA
jgi:hypothetical protein